MFLLRNKYFIPTCFIGSGEECENVKSLQTDGRVDDLINNMDHMRILGTSTEPSSVILVKQSSLKDEK